MSNRPFDEYHWDMRCRNWGLWVSVDVGRPSRMGNGSGFGVSPDDQDAIALDRALCDMKCRRGPQGFMRWRLIQLFYERRLWDTELCAAPMHSLHYLMAREFHDAWTRRNDGMTGDQRAMAMLSSSLAMLADIDRSLGAM